MEIYKNEGGFSLIATRLACFLLAVIMGLCTNCCVTAQIAPPHESVDNLNFIEEPPQTKSPVVLSAINDLQTGKAAFEFMGATVPPVIHVQPGTTLNITYINSMSKHSTEKCMNGPCMNMTNLHFHGLHVSPNSPQDDVISMMAPPGETLHYAVTVPRDQPPGLYWYHTHPHGESYQQDLDGMSGAIVVDGIEQYVPEIRTMQQQVLILRDRVVEESDPEMGGLQKRVDASQSCAPALGSPHRLFTVNGALRPAIPIAPGERQFWRIVNASPDLYADLEITGEQLEIVALDGMPLGFHTHRRRIQEADHFLLPPSGRLETIVTGPHDGTKMALRSRCFDTGADGDPNPSMVLADLVSASAPTPHAATKSNHSGSEVYKVIPAKTLKAVEEKPVDYTVSFTEDKNGFYINGRKYGPSDPPMTTATIGSYYHWRVINATKEVHPFHIHQVHFLLYAQNGQFVDRPEWRDTVNVPAGGTVDLVMDFTDPIIHGISLFHCHLLSHEDKGMMAKILFK